MHNQQKLDVKNTRVPFDKTYKLIDLEAVPHQRPSWDEIFISMCHLIASKSHDPRTKIGSVIVAKDNAIQAVGYNGFPRGISSRPEILESPEKYKWMSHAEENAIANSSRNGTSIIDSTIYVNLMPCNACARTIIQHGIGEVVVHKTSQQIYEKSSGKDGSYWDESFLCTKEMFAESGLKLRQVEYAPRSLALFFNGQNFTI